MRERITAEQISEVWAALVRNAVEGSVTAQKAVIEYALSRPNLGVEDEQNENHEYTFIVVNSSHGEETAAPLPAIEGECTTKVEESQ